MAAPTDFLNNVQKKIINAGSRISAFPDGAKTHFHYKTTLCDDVGTVLDDSKHLHKRHDHRNDDHTHDHDHRNDDHTHDHDHRNDDHTHDHDHKDSPGKPLEVIIGKKFKLEVWEACLKTMAVGEVASFRVDKTLCLNYPVVAKTLRDIATKKAKEHKHVCGMMSLKDQGGLGYKDLDDLMTKPQDLIFTFELLRVDEPGEYEMDTWTLTDAEKCNLVPKLQEDGNNLYKEKCFSEASDKYGKAIGLLEELMLKEKPRCEHWLELQAKKEPLLLNYAQCRLLLKDYYAVIEHTTTVLETNPDNVKALFRRAKAHVGAWNPTEAISDFDRVMELDPKLTATVRKELKQISEMQLQQDTEDKHRFKEMFVR